MGWGTDFTANLYLNRMIFQSKGELEDKIEELEKDLESTKAGLTYYLGMRRKDYSNEESELLYDFLETLEWRDQIINDLKILYIYKEYLEEKDGEI